MKPIDIGSLTNSQTTNLTITVADPPPNLLKHGLCSFNEWKPMGWMRRDFIGVPFSESTTRCCCFFSLGYFIISKHTCISVYIYIYIILCIYHANHIIQPYNIYMHTSNCYDFHLVDALFLFEHLKIRTKIAHPQKSAATQLRGRQIRVLVLAFPASYSEQGPRAKLWRVEGGGGKKVEMRWWWLQPGRRTWQAGKTPFSIGDTFSNGCFSIVMLVFECVVGNLAAENVIYPRVYAWKWMVSRLVSFKDGPCSGARLILGSADTLRGAKKFGERSGWRAYSLFSMKGTCFYTG